MTDGNEFSDFGNVYWVAALKNINVNIYRPLSGCKLLFVIAVSKNYF